jgi:VCBS repeat-containing protein
VTVAALVAASAVLAASAGSGPRHIKVACARKSDGVLRYVDSASKCSRRTERVVRLDRSTQLHACVQQYPRTRLDPDADGDVDVRGHGIVLAGVRDTDRDAVHAARAHDPPVRRLGAIWLVHRWQACARLNQHPVLLPAGWRTYFCAARRDGRLRFVRSLSRCGKRELGLILDSFTKQNGIGNSPNGPNGNGPPGNTPPTANADSATTDEKHATTIGVLANDVDPSPHPLQVATVDTTGTKGHVTVNADSTIAYDPNGQFNSLQAGQAATDHFTYTATDGHLSSAPATVTVTITGINDPPALSGIESGALAYTAGNPKAITATLTAADVDDSNLSGATVSISSGFVSTEDSLSFTNQNGIIGSYSSSTGVLTLSGSATVANYQTALRSVKYLDSQGASPNTATRTISFQATDPHSAASNTVSRSVTVSPNSAPTATGDSTSTGKHAATDISVLANDSDADGDPLTVSSVDTTGTKGSVSINSDNTIHYDPNGQFDSLQAGHTATDTFKYKANDGFSDSNAATVTVTIDGSNDAPVLAGVESSALSYQAGSAATAITSSLTASDDDDSNLSGGKVWISSGFASGEDSLSFTNQNGITGSYDSSTGVLTLSGTATVADYQTALRSVKYSDSNGGSASTAMRTISFQATDPHSSDSNTVTRDISVTRNPAPTAVDDTAATDKNTATDISVLSNDSDSDGDSLTASSLDTTGTKGSVSINSDNTIHYDPNGQFDSLQAGHTATDTFKYKANDGFSDSGWATVTVTINGTNNAPALSGIETTALSYQAGDPAAAITASLSASDVDDSNASGATVSITSGFASTEDSLSFANQNGITGSYSSSTGVLTLSGTASVADYQTALRSVKYSDSNGASASTTKRTIAFQLTDPHGAGSNFASRDVTVSRNPAPTATDDTASTDKNTAKDISVLSNDSDTDGDSLTVSQLDTTGTTGSVSINSDNTIHYDPSGQFNSLQSGQSATDTFKYKANDGFSDSGWATVTVTINGTNNAPTLSGIETTAVSYQAGDPAAAITSTLTVSDVDDSNLSGGKVWISSGFASGEDSLSFTNQNGITGSYDSSTGILTLSGTATVANYQTALRSVKYSDSNGGSASTATRTISFQATDPHSATSNTATRDISVSRNPPPTATDDTASTDSLTATDINVLSNDSDSDGDLLTVSQLDTTGTKGSVSINADSSIHYDPNGQFSSLAKGATTTDTFKYKANDGFSDSGWATVTVTITGANHPPVLANIESTALSGYKAQDPAVQITSSLTASDSDNTNLASATVSITSGLASGDALNFTNQNGISGSYNSTSGVLTLTGSASVADYQTALRSVTFSNSSAATSSTTRTVTFQADDGESNNHASNTQSRDISVGPANQAPSAGTDSYSAVGNTTLGVGTSPSGPAVTQTGSVLSNDSDPDSANSLTATAGTITTTQGGSVTMNSDGTFTYLPKQGFSGADSFTYTVSDSDDASNPKSTTGTVNISVGTVVWYVDNSKTSAGDGRSTSPFNTLAAADAKAGTGDVMFLYQGSGNYAGGTTMHANEQLIGQPNGLTVSGHSLVAAGGTNPVITNSSGDGIDLASGATIRRVDVSSPSGAGISGTGITTADIGSSISISGASGSSFKLSGGTGNVSMGASISNTAGHSVDISGRTGGTTTLSGDVSDSGTGVLLSSNTGATIDLTGKITASTGTNKAFTATGGGTVIATGSGSTLTTTTGTALAVANTTIGTGGLNFQAISANGAANGIDLISTGTTAGLTVSGTGSGGSGGTIQNTTADAIFLNGTSSPSFNDMNITSPQHDGVDGISVHGFTYTNGTISSAGAAHTQQTDSALAFNNNSPAATNDNLDGAVTITGNTISSPYGGGVDILNFNGTISDANISSNTITSTTSTTTSKGSGIALNLFGNATTVPNLTKAEIENNVITNFPSGDGINVQGGNNTSGTAPSGTYGTPGDATNVVTISGNQAGGSYAGGKCLPGNGACMNGAAINANVTGRGQGNFNISSNGTTAHPLGRSIGSPFQTGAAGSVTASFAIENNVVSAFNAGGGDGIGLGVDKNQQADATVLANPTVKATITGNQVSNYDGGGVHFIQLDSNGTTNLKIDSNTTSSPESDNQSGAGIEVDEGSSGSASYNPSLCSEIKSNSAAAGNANGFGDSVPGIVITKESTSSSTYSFGIVGLSPSPANESQTQSYLAGQNPSSGAGGGFYAGTTVFANPGDQWTSCTLPAMP